MHTNIPTCMIDWLCSSSSPSLPHWLISSSENSAHIKSLVNSLKFHMLQFLIIGGGNENTRTLDTYKMYENKCSLHLNEILHNLQFGRNLNKSQRGCHCAQYLLRKTSNVQNFLIRLFMYLYITM